MSYVEREIEVQFELGQGAFGESGFDTVTLSGLRCSVNIENAGLPFLATAHVVLSGMQPSIANQLSTLGGNPYLAGRLNQITVLAGDSAAGMSQVFQGVITNGWQDFDGAPDVVFVVDAIAGALDLVKPGAPSSYPGSADVATIMQALAARATPPLTFVNEGVQITLANPYFPGTVIDQIRACASAANINAEIANGTLTIWPRNGFRTGMPTIISPDTGMVGYPTFNGVQIIGLRTVFDPTLRYGSLVKVESSLPNASGSWYCAVLSHALESVTPGGAWFSDLSVVSKDYILSQPSY